MIHFMTTMTFIASSQTNTKEYDYFQSIFGMAKKDEKECWE
jgi:hypothetical protein